MCKFKKIPHDNSTSVPYVRADPALLKEAARITKEKHQKPLKTIQMMLDDSINAPNAKQSRYKVYRDTKKPTQHRGRGAERFKRVKTAKITCHLISRSR